MSPWVVNMFLDHFGIFLNFLSRTTPFIIVFFPILILDKFIYKVRTGKSLVDILSSVNFLRIIWIIFLITAIFTGLRDMKNIGMGILGLFYVMPGVLVALFFFIADLIFTIFRNSKSKQK